MKDIIETKLKEQGYDSKSASLVAAELLKVDCSLNSLVEDWLNDKQTDFEAQGYTISGLMKSRGMTYPAALLTIDWLIKEPEKAINSLKRGVR